MDIKKIYYMKVRSYTYPDNIDESQIELPEHLRNLTHRIYKEGNNLAILEYKVSLKEIWKPIKIKFTDRDEGTGKFLKKEPDITSYGYFLFSETLINKTKDLLPNSIEFLEIINTSFDKKYFFMNLLEDGIDCLTPESKIRKHPDPNIIEIMDIKKHEFYYDIIKDKHFFMIKNHSLHTYVSDVFVQRVLEHKLKGFWFVPIWTLENGGIENPYFKSDENPDIIRT